MTKILYSGSFDPITNGHIKLIEEASELFDEIFIAVMQNSAKILPFFTINERINILNEIFKNNKKVKIVTGSGATVDIAKANGCSAILRGLRSVSDFDYENQMAQINKDISDGSIKTICMFADSDLQSVSSSVVKEVFSLNKDISKYVPQIVYKKMQEKIKENL